MQTAYWLWVTNGRSLPDSVRAVGIDKSLEPGARAAAERLARELGVLVEPSSPPGADAAQGRPQAPETGTAFDQPADPRLGAPFEQGRRDGT
jgi:hypothetical protein